MMSHEAQVTQQQSDGSHILFAAACSVGTAYACKPGRVVASVRSMTETKTMCDLRTRFAEGCVFSRMSCHTSLKELSGCFAWGPKSHTNTREPSHEANPTQLHSF